MSDLLVTASLTGGAGSSIAVATSGDTANWTETSIPQSSSAAPALAVLNNDLWAAFRGASDSKIYSAGLSDWNTNTYTGQDSDFAPALAAVGTALWLGYIGKATGHLELISSSGGAWSTSKTDTGQSSALSPALAALGSTLWAAFQGSGGTQLYAAAASNWANKTAIGQSSKLAPAMASFNGQLWVAYIGESSGHVELVSSTNGNSWPTKIDTGQSSNFTPALSVFNGKLWVGYIGEASKHVELVAVDTSGKVSPKVDTGQPSNMAPALASIPAADPPSGLGGNVQYVLASPVPARNQKPIALQNIVVEIKITEPIKVNPGSGLSPTATYPLPIGFQINGFSPTDDDKTIVWQQYGIKMWPDSNMLVSFAESWPPGAAEKGLANVFQISSQQYNNSFITLPDDLTIPDWTFRFQFQQQSDGTIQGFACTVTDANGHTVGPASGLGINLLNNVPLAAGGVVTQKDLATLVAFQVVLVGYWDSAQAVLESGAGQITVESSTQMTPQNFWPTDSSDTNGTAENTNSTYSLVPAQSGTRIAQTFGTQREGVFSNGYALEMLVVTQGGKIMAGASNDGVNWWHSHAQTPGFVDTGHTTQAAPGLVVVQRDSGFGSFYMAILGQDNNNLFWRGSGDGVSWEGGSIGSQLSKFGPSLMMYYNTQNTGAGPWLGYVANNSTNELLVTSAESWDATWAASTPINQFSKCTPAFTGCIDYYVMVFVANDSSNRLLACRTQPNGQGQWGWGGSSDTGQQSPAAPSITGLGDNLWMAFLSNDSSQNILVCSSADGISWSGSTQTGHTSRTAPCITNCGGVLVLAFVGVDDGIVRICSSSDGIHWSESTPVAGLQTAFTPAIAGYNFGLSFSLG